MIHSILSWLWWNLIPGATVELKWPRSSVPVAVHLGTIHSFSPTLVYGPWLEENIGKQGWDWNWEWDYTGPIQLKVRIGKREMAALTVLKWG